MLRYVAPLTLLLACGGASPVSSAPAAPAAQAEEEPFKRITLDELAARLERKEKLVLYDANMRDRYDQGHIPGARWVDVQSFGAAELPPDRDAELVFYCFNPQCTSSHQAARRAASLGYRRVSVMPHGILAWEKAGKTTEKSPAP